MQPLAPKCPRCAAPMSAPAGSTELICGTCGQRAPHGYAGPAGIDEAKARHRREGDRIQRNGAVGPLVIGIVFLAFALGCAIVTAVEAVGALSGGMTDFGSLPAGLLGWPLFALFWAGLGAALVFIGGRTLRQLALRKRLRTAGVRGFGTVLEWDESESNGMTIYEMKLNVAVPGQHPYVVRVREISFVQSVYANLTLPVLVDPADARNVVVDWDGR